MLIPLQLAEQHVSVVGADVGSGQPTGCVTTSSWPHSAWTLTHRALRMGPVPVCDLHRLGALHPARAARAAGFIDLTGCP